MIGIYKITSPTGKVYIGQTFDSRARFRTYKRLERSSIGRRLYNSLVKHGATTHRFAMIHTLPADVSQAVMNDYEKLYIAQYRNCGLELLNLTEGGEGSKGYKHTQEALLKMSIMGKGRFAGNKNPNYGKGCFGDSNGAFGKSRRHLCLKAAQANEKPVFQFALNGQFIKEFKSATEAAKELNLKTTNISSCCLEKKGYKTAGGFVWKHNRQ